MRFPLTPCAQLLKQKFELCVFSSKPVECSSTHSESFSRTLRTTLQLMFLQEALLTVLRSNRNCSTQTALAWYRQAVKVEIDRRVASGLLIQRLGYKGDVFITKWCTPLATQPACLVSCVNGRSCECLLQVKAKLPDCRLVCYPLHNHTLLVHLFI